MENIGDYPIFMATASAIGYDVKTKVPRQIYRRDENGDLKLDKDGNPVLDTDIPEIIEAFYEFKRRHKLRF